VSRDWILRGATWLLVTNPRDRPVPHRSHTAERRRGGTRVCPLERQRVRAGLVWLFASDTGEAAQESDELRGALFTHYWVSGLRGAADANGDGRVTLAESYDFAYSQTLYRSAQSSGVLDSGRSPTPRRSPRVRSRPRAFD
jgi:uncharacterized caspase-like protein